MDGGAERDHLVGVDAGDRESLDLLGAKEPALRRPPGLIHDPSAWRLRLRPGPEAAPVELDLTSACMPSTGLAKRHPASVNSARAAAWPAQSPVGTVPTMKQLPGAGDDGGSSRGGSSTAAATIMSSR